MKGLTMSDGYCSGCKMEEWYDKKSKTWIPCDHTCTER